MQEINTLHARYCKGCDNWLPFDEFYSSKRNKDKMNYTCKKCCHEYNKKLRTPEKARKYSLQASHNITQEQYDRMFKEQNGICYICKQPETVKLAKGKIKPLAVDHNHNTDEIRMLLCQHCNITLEYIEKDIHKLGDFLGYLDEMKDRGLDTTIIQFPLSENNETDQPLEGGEILNESLSTTDTYLSPKQAAEEIGMNRFFILEEIKRGNLLALKMSRSKYRIRKADWEAYKKSKETA